MEIFKEAHDFSLNNLYVSDGGGNDVVAMFVLKELANAACLGAGYQSDERHDAPKCHPETREAVIKDIMSWVNDKDSNEAIMWLTGSAGAGKSAIAQTVCVKCHNEKKLLASFFFSRTATASGRSEAKRLVPTIACQLAVAIPEVKPLIIKRLNNDSVTLTYSMETQLRRLVLEPLTEIYNKMEKDKSHTAKDGHSPYLVVIDGLDECNDPKDQSRIVGMISGLFGPQEQIRLRFLIASRPELEIRNSFKTVTDSGKCATIILNEFYKPDDDIRTYLRSEFDALKREHTLREHLHQGSGWPSPKDVKYLVEKSSGQFIYASTVIKYLQNPRRDPRQGLRAIQDNTDKTTLQINAPKNESPYTSLDSLYRHILATSSASYDSCKIIFQIMLFAYQHSVNKSNQTLGPLGYLLPTLRALSSFTGMTKVDLELLLADFHSILYIPGNWDAIRFYHASFGDFLKDTSRSGYFYISKNEAHKCIAQRCLSIILEMSPIMDWLNEAQNYSIDRFFEHLQDSDFDDELLSMLRSETTLHAVLDVLSKYKAYDYLEYVIEFSFDGQCESVTESQPYWIPRTEKLQDICLSIVKFVEERFLFRIGLIGHDVMEALYYREDKHSYISVRNYFDWLLCLLESPIHGKQIYLNSKNSFILYKKLIQETDIDTLRQYGHGENTCYPLVLKYLLMRIQPSAAYTDSDLFTRKNRMFTRQESEQFIKDLHSTTERFLERCRELKKQEEEEMKRKQEEDFRRQQEELKQKKEEEMKQQQEEQQMKRSFRNRLMSPIKNVQHKLKDKLR